MKERPNMLLIIEDQEQQMQNEMAHQHFELTMIN